MQHGRDHEERQQKAERPRHNNVPPGEPDVALEEEIRQSGRGGVRPHEGLVGAHDHRGAHGDTVGSAEEGEEPTGPGSDVAPTKKAAEREHLRHEKQRALGVVPAAEDGHIRQQRDPSVTREDLDRAARETDEAITARRGGSGR